MQKMLCQCKYGSPSVLITFLLLGILNGAEMVLLEVDPYNPILWRLASKFKYYINFRIDHL